MSALNSLLEAMSHASGKSYFPHAPENIANPDYDAGYRIGLENDGKSIADSDHAINVEWRRRGQPEAIDESFASWKRGYWAGRYSAVVGRV